MVGGSTGELAVCSIGCQRTAEPPAERGKRVNGARTNGEQWATPWHLGPEAARKGWRLSYHRGVDSTTAMLVGGAVGVLIGAGAMLAFGVSERQQQAIIGTVNTTTWARNPTVVTGEPMTAAQFLG